MQPDQRPTRAIAGVLKIGSYSSTALIAFGVLLAVFVPSRMVHYGPQDMVRGVFRIEPAAVMQTGIALLLLTPVARVAVAAAGFAIEGDRKYAVISAVVLFVVLSSILFRVG